MRKPFTVVAVDLGGTKIAGALVRYEAGEAPAIVARADRPTNAREGGSAVLARIIEVCLELIEQSADAPVGVGIAAAGCIDPADGSVAYANGLMPDWTGQPLCAAVSEACGLPAAALGDVQGHALGEARWGAAKTLSSCLLVAAGTGIGGAYVLEGKVLRGAHGAAGHIGHTLHHRAAEFPCVCGAEAHVEAVTSGTGIGALYQGVPVSSADYDTALDGAEVSRRAEAGEERAIEALRQSGFILGQACGSWANIFDPAAIVLTGTVTKAGPVWYEAVLEGFKTQALVPMQDIAFMPAELGADAPLIGAAEHLLDTLEV